jgi:hypothetical protein
MHDLGIQRKGAKAQSRQVARGSSNVRRGPSRPRRPGTVKPRRRSERRRSSRRLGSTTYALGERRSRLSRCSESGWDSDNRVRAGSQRRHRCAAGASDREKAGRAERWRSGRTAFFLVADDREIDGRTPDHSKQPGQSRKHPFAPLHLCVCSLWAISVSLCLCVSALAFLAVGVTLPTRDPSVRSPRSLSRDDIPIGCRSLPVVMSSA